MNDAFTINKIVMTPNSWGTIQGRIWDNGALAILVRHKEPVIDSKGGHPAMRTASSLYVYSQEEVT